jgi:hypothetical protein
MTVQVALLYLEYLYSTRLKTKHVPAVEGNGIHATQVSNQDTVVLLHYP